VREPGSILKRALGIPTGTQDSLKTRRIDRKPKKKKEGQAEILTWEGTDVRSDVFKKNDRGGTSDRGGVSWERWNNSKKARGAEGRRVVKKEGNNDCKG